MTYDDPQKQDEAEFKRVRRIGRALRTAQRVVDLPFDAVGRGQPITESAKATLLEEGIEARATILKAPVKGRVSRVQENIGRFTVSVELPNAEPYEVKVWQSFWAQHWDRMPRGSTVDCLVDPDDHDSVLLIPPEVDDAPRVAVKGRALNVKSLFKRRISDSSDLIASGRRATAKVLSSEPMEMTAPGTEDEIFLLQLELSADDEPDTWNVEIGQRVPKGAEDQVTPGSELQVAYRSVKDTREVAVNWPATSGGRFS